MTPVTPTPHPAVTRSLSERHAPRGWRRLRLLVAAAPALFALTGVAALGVAALHAEQSEATPIDAAALRAQLHAEAVASFRAGRYADAYGRFATLADAGHVPSAQIALVMLRQGHELFGSDWSATPGQQARWAELVVQTARRAKPMPAGEGRE